MRPGKPSSLPSLLHIASALLAGLWWAGPATAVRVAPGSECARHCGNVLDHTESGDVPCSEVEYAASAGKVFTGCVGCELASGYASQGQTDQQWMLFNVRYALSHCLFGIPDGEAVSSPCLTNRACELFQPALTFAGLAQNTSAYDYCALWQSDLLTACASCLRAGGDHKLSNYMVLLDTGCQQQPRPGSTIYVDGDPFSRDIVTMADPRPAVTASYFADSGFPLSGKVGISVGGVGLILAVAGFCIVWNGKRRRRAFLRQLELRSRTDPPGWPLRQAPPEMHDTPVSQRPLRAWAGGESPVSVRNLSPYSSQYSSPVSAASPAMAALLQPVPGPVVPDKGKARDGGSFEMQRMAGQSLVEPPVLSHPGYGKGRQAI